MTVTSDAAVLKVLGGDQPLTTQEIRAELARTGGVNFEDVPIYRLRRTLERLEGKGLIVGSGGPKRDDLPEWPLTDGRDVCWASKTTADRIAKVHEERVELQASIEEEREQLLRTLHRLLRPFERDSLELTGLTVQIRLWKDDFGAIPSARTMRDIGFIGPLAWPIEVLRVVVGAVVEARGGEVE